MAEVFAVFREGVYRHECGGVFSTKDAAVQFADFLAAADVDSYHSYEVYPFVLDGRAQLEKAAIISPKICEPAPVYSCRKQV